MIVARWPISEQEQRRIGKDDQQAYKQIGQFLMVYVIGKHVNQIRLQHFCSSQMAPVLVVVQIPSQYPNKVL